MSTLPLTIFFLGATGFVGGEVLRLLASDLPDFPVRALVRNVTSEKETELRRLHPNIRIVEGTLNSDALIREEASKCDIVINTASSDHHPSVLSTLAGLTTRSAANPANPPIYIHISGAGIIEDNARGELLTPSHIWYDTDMDLRAVKDVTHIVSDLDIVKAGTRTENRIRTMILFPGWIYGVGSGVQKVTMPIRLYVDLAIQAGHAGTFGNGKNAMGEIHVKDVASAVLTCLKAALEGNADEGAAGLYFVLHPRMAVMKDIMTGIGNAMKVPGCEPLPARITDAWGEFGWALLGGTIWGRGERLKKVGWRPTHTEKITLQSSLRDEVGMALANLGDLRPPDYSDATM
ncbi:NAD(P)-binding protein [Schizophyllum commune H4-8]|nr:NAD(P)-binding protein [Schizophyllum commune H4-8]KAI5895665.1 NAD(P)-binding protein [Schizophyllum commune H4-8]